MTLPVETRVYAPISAPRTQSSRPQPSAGALGESTQRAAQAFMDALAPDVRARIKSVSRDPYRQNNADNAQDRVDDVASESRNADSPSSFDGSSDATAKPLYSAPYLSSGPALLQAQAARSAYEDYSDVSDLEYRESHNAYLNAGAQPGGEAAALQAELLAQERAQKTLIVPPVLTSVNTLA